MLKKKNKIVHLCLNLFILLICLVSIVPQVSGQLNLPIKQEQNSVLQQYRSTLGETAQTVIGEALNPLTQLGSNINTTLKWGEEDSFVEDSVLVDNWENIEGEIKCYKQKSKIKNQSTKASLCNIKPTMNYTIQG